MRKACAQKGRGSRRGGKEQGRRKESREKKARRFLARKSDSNGMRNKAAQKAGSFADSRGWWGRGGGEKIGLVVFTRRREKRARQPAPRSSISLLMGSSMVNILHRFARSLARSLRPRFSLLLLLLLRVSAASRNARPTIYAAPVIHSGLFLFLARVTSCPSASFCLLGKAGAAR